MRIRLSTRFRHYEPGTIFEGHITEDDLNFYVHGVNNEYPAGYFSNYLTVPKYAAYRVDEPKRL